MPDHKSTIEELKQKVKKFIQERDWEQYHSPKNVSMSLAIEAAELMEVFQWLNDHQSIQLNDEQKKQVNEEMADVALYLFDLCNVLGVDLSEAVEKKLVQNEQKYPVDLAKGKSHKYTHYQK